MLARSFKTAEELGLAEVEVQSLFEVLHRLERGKLVSLHDQVSMGKDTLFMAEFLYETKECGTVGCICGWAHLLSEKKAFPELSERFATRLSDRLPAEAVKVFMLIHFEKNPETKYSSTNPPTEEIVTALRNYLTTGVSGL